MTVEDIILASLVVIVAVIGWFFLAYVARLVRDSHERLEAVRRGEQHIAELVAEVLQRSPER
jgi:hypothetical protein